MGWTGELRVRGAKRRVRVPIEACVQGGMVSVPQSATRLSPSCIL